MANPTEGDAVMKFDLEATHLRGRRWAVKPAGQLGTCGFHPVPWTVVYVTASSASDAVKRAMRKRAREERGNLR